MTCEENVLEYLIAKGLIEDFGDKEIPTGEKAAKIIIEAFNDLFKYIDLSLNNNA